MKLNVFHEMFRIFDYIDIKFLYESIGKALVELINKQKYCKN